MDNFTLAAIGLKWTSVPSIADYKAYCGRWNTLLERQDTKARLHKAMKLYQRLSGTSPFNETIVKRRIFDQALIVHDDILETPVRERFPS
jgi:hypothetical protein